MNLLKTLFEESKNRVKNPIIGTFILSWIVLNWKAISVFFLSDIEIISRVKYIDENYLDTETSLVIPLILTFIYIVVLPYLILIFNWLLKKANQKRKENHIIEKLEEYESKHKIAREEVKLQEIKTDFKEKKELNLKIKTLQAKLDSKDEQIGELSDLLELSKINGIESKVSSEEENNLNMDYDLFMMGDLSKFFYDIGKAISENGDFRNYIDTIVIEKYKYNDILVESAHSNSGYELTSKGKYFWKKFVLTLDLDENYK